jgi:hypothetical protein
MKKVVRADGVRNKVLQIVEDERNILHTVKKKEG